MTVNRPKDDATSIVIVLCCLFLPPLGVLLLNGIGPDFIISICLTILGWIPGVIHALWLWMRAGGLNDRTRSEARIERFKRKFQERRAKDGRSNETSTAPAVPPASGAASEELVPAVTTDRQRSDVARVDGSRLEDNELTATQRQSLVERESSTATATTITPAAAPAAAPAAVDSPSATTSSSKPGTFPAIPVFGNLLKRRNAKRNSAASQTVPAYPTRRIVDDSFEPLPPLTKTAPITTAPTPNPNAAIAAAAAMASAGPSSQVTPVLPPRETSHHESSTVAADAAKAAAAKVEADPGTTVKDNAIQQPTAADESDHSSDGKKLKELKKELKDKFNKKISRKDKSVTSPTAADVVDEDRVPIAGVSTVEAAPTADVDTTAPAGETTVAGKAGKDGGVGGGGFYRGLFARAKGKARADGAATPPTTTDGAAPATVVAAADGATTPPFVDAVATIESGDKTA